MWLIASKVGIAAGLALLPMYAAELFPHSLRASVVDALQQVMPSLSHMMIAYALFCVLLSRHATCNPVWLEVSRGVI